MIIKIQWLMKVGLRETADICSGSSIWIIVG
ncbi:hypothetical protein LCGC14_1082480 [marine sediment metagenome]|uniref:Uncharacterized protein n=1 Tax=marine sediment metagenome TaxID=412755 RepID=A0A0F9MJG3_9ZZZZ